jgi:hypothetical protein
VFRLIGHLPFSYFVAHFSFSLFFFASHNTYKRTGMTNVNDILEKKRREETISRPLFLPLFSYLQPSSVYLIVFCSYTENVVIFFCNGWPTIFFSWTETPLLSLFLSLSLVVAIIIMYACLCWPEKSPNDPSSSLSLSRFFSFSSIFSSE